MRKSSTHPGYFELQVVNATTPNGTRLVLVGKKGPLFDKPATPQCSSCLDFQQVVTLAGVAICDNPVHAEEKPPLPKREPGATNPPKPRATARPLSVLAR